MVKNKGLIVKYIARHPKERFTAEDIATAIKNDGYVYAPSVSAVANVLRTNKLARKIEKRNFYEGEGRVRSASEYERL